MVRDRRGPGTSPRTGTDQVCCPTAYLNVFEQEPLPADSPLWEMPGVLITPHNSAVSSGNDDRAVEIFLDNLVRWHAGRPLTNHVTAIE